MVELGFFRIYLLIFGILFVIQSFIFMKIKINNEYFPSMDKIVFIFSLLILTILVGGRDPYNGTDTIRYIQDFEYMQSFKSFDFDLLVNRSTVGRDPIFVVFSYFLGTLVNSSTYIFIIAALFYLFFYRFVIKITFRFYSLHLFTFILFTFFLSFQINIIRSGISVMLVLYGISFLVENYELKKLRELTIKSKVKSILLISTGILIHSASIILLFSCLLAYIFRLAKKYYLWFFICSLGLAYLKFGIGDLPIIGPYFLASDRAALYLSGEASQPPSGVNLYVVFFQILIIIYFYLQEKSIRDNIFGSFLLNTYLILSSFYMFCLNISYSDRFGLYSWCLMPLILIYPLIVQKITYKQLFVFSVFAFSYFILMLYRIDFV